MATNFTTMDEKIQIGRIFSNMFGVIGRNPGVILGLSLLISGMPQALLQYYQVERFGINGIGPDFSRLPEYLTIVLSGVAIAIILGALLNAMISRAAIVDLSDGGASFGDCLSAALPAILPVIGIGILSGLAVAIGMIFLIVPGIYLWLGWSVAIPILIQERAGVFGSMSRSRELTRGNRWRLFALFLIIVVMVWIVQVAFGLLSFFGASLGQASLSLAVAAAINGTVSSVLITTAAAVSYIELRRVKEGTSIDELAQVFA